MRPRREPAELATITIGNRTITSMIGSGPPRKRIPEDPPLVREPPRRKRRIHTPSRPNIFGEHMKSFAAPGSQLDDKEDKETSPSEDDQVEEDEDDIPSEIEDTQSTEQEPEDEGSPPPEDTEYVPDQGAAQPETENTEVPAANENLDESQKKAQEEAIVERLIHEAEETTVLPQENSANRAKKMNKGAAHRDATTQLVGTLDGSISHVQSQLITLQKTMQVGSKKTQDEATDLGEKTAEDKLSLTVSKNDFAQMRVIGQFNLGFIIAVRPGEDHDELFIIDQHASDEKFNFERLQAETVVQNQRLVRPQRLDLTAVEEEVVLENRAALEKNGFLVTVDESGDEPIGRRCRLVSLPLSKEVVFGVRDLEELIVLLSESISTSNGLSVPRPSKVRKMFAMRACRSSIMIGKTLTSRQMERVVQNMGTIDKPWNCPHGRPTMRHLMSLGQWDEWNEYQTEGLDPWKQYLEGEDEDEEEDEE
jgi:DNA mismatch repair enzyme (predicted ATPase)